MGSSNHFEWYWLNTDLRASRSDLSILEGYVSSCYWILITRENLELGQVRFDMAQYQIPMDTIFIVLADCSVLHHPDLVQK